MVSRLRPQGGLRSFSLTHFMPLVSFDTPRKHQKTFGFLMFSRGIERDQWNEMRIFFSNTFMKLEKLKIKISCFFKHNVSICLITKICLPQIFPDFVNVNAADLKELTKGCYKLLWIRVLYELGNREIWCFK